MAVIAQVRTTILEHSLFLPGDAVVVGVSGGPDSLTLLHVLCALRKELHIDLHVAHLNHQLRGDESDADAQFVARLAQEWGLGATIEARDVRALASAARLSLEEAGRHARYAFLVKVAQRVGATVIAVAHNADDQVETVLMHWLRGAGLAGLRGMGHKIEIQNSKFKISEGESEFRISNFEFRIVRPLLDVTRAEIEAYCRRHHLAPRQDRSNLDTTFFRNRLRQEVLPYLETLNPHLRQVLLHSSRVIADDYALLSRNADAVFAEIARQVDGAIVFDRAAWRALHPALQRGTLRAAVEELRGDLRDIDWTPIEDARRVALDKSTGAAATLPGGLILTVGYVDLTIAATARGGPAPDLPQLHAERVDLPTQGVTELPNSDWVVETDVTARPETAMPEPQRWRARLDLDKCRGNAYLRRRRPGDRFQPAGMNGHTKALHEFMIDAKIPRLARDRLPLLVVDERIAWVCGWRIDERARATAETREFWQVTFRKKDQP